MIDTFCRKLFESIGLFNKNLVGAVKATLIKDAICSKENKKKYLKSFSKNFEIPCKNK